MSAINYYSIYKPLIEEFVALKRHLGYKYMTIEYAFMQFDQLVYEREETAIGISRELCDEWCIRRPNESDKTWYNRIQAMRQFGTYLNKLNYRSYLPVLPKIKPSPIHPISTPKRKWPPYSR